MDNFTPDILVLYLDGELSVDEKKGVEQQLASDAAMKLQLDSLLLTREGVRLFGLKQHIAGLHREMMNELKPNVRQLLPARSKPKFSRIAIGIAASLVLLIGTYFLVNKGKSTPEKIFASNYQTYELSTLRDVNSVQTDAEKAFRAKNYTEVIRLHDAGEDHSVKGEFLCGVAAMETNDFSKAISCLKEVLETNRQTGELTFKDETEYYLSLSYIHQKEYDNALLLLNAIYQDPAHTYHVDVDEKLIRQVERLKNK